MPNYRDLVVYTDGACLGNGHHGAVGGVGVYFGPNDNRNYSGPLPGQIQTNQRAELEAIYQALVLIRDSLYFYRYRPSVIIRTDSQYSINCVTKWSRRWRRHGWINSMGKPVTNVDLVQEILELMDTCGSDIYFEYVPGHLNIPGNIAAHDLASAGARGHHY
ncbi:hypothetical protein GGI08_004996 [Coemansia sp. S2]|nr:hypothetical protein GGI08_004996 [Coemansia sp. S2]KAJ2339390.1 hypothetical protein GGH92_006742 [Coemansia sp. RSA 2673]